MLVTAQIKHTPTVKHLVKLWTERYKPNLVALSQTENTSIDQIFVTLASSEGRSKTVEKLRSNLVQLNCQLASIRSRGLYEPVPNMVDFAEAKRLTQCSSNIYTKLLELYQKADIGDRESNSNAAALNTVEKLPGMMPNVVGLAASLEPTLMLFQSQYISAKDWRTLGSLTTQLYFANDLLLGLLSPSERIIAAPYFKFIEEQIALPWQRMCAAAAKHDLESPAFILVEQLLPQANDIAEVVFQKLLKRFPKHSSRRGKLTHPGIAHSCIRDLNMFQAYLWLCVLQKNMTPITNELVELCIMVLPRVGVKWELIEQWNYTLVEELVNRMNSSQKVLFEPYAQALIQSFEKYAYLLNDLHYSPDSPLPSHSSDLLRSTKLMVEMWNATGLLRMTSQD